MLEQGKPLPGYYVTFNPFLYSVENSLPLVKFGQVDRWHPAPSPPLPWRSSCFCEVLQWFFSWEVILGTFRAFQIACGWFLATIGVAGLTGVIRKD